jgi:hypothetical protein
MTVKNLELKRFVCINDIQNPGRIVIVETRSKRNAPKIGVRVDAIEFGALSCCGVEVPNASLWICRNSVPTLLATRVSGVVVVCKSDLNLVSMNENDALVRADGQIKSGDEFFIMPGDIQPEIAKPKTHK